MTDGEIQFPDVNDVLSRNLKGSLGIREFSSELLKVMNSYNSLNCWADLFTTRKLTGVELVAEIFEDIFISTYYALCALYKYADMALRSAFENSLNLAYFYSHPVEFGWWKEGSEWYIDKGSHPWGDYTYFVMLSGDLPKTDPTLEARLKTHYAKLSKSIHSTAESFQTTQNKLTPKVEMARLMPWAKRAQITVSLMNVVLVVALRNELSNVSSKEKTQIKDSILSDHAPIIESIEWFKET
jgi:hypothetical protein